jgi:hypothetical protein
MQGRWAQTIRWGGVRGGTENSQQTSLQCRCTLSQNCCQCEYGRRDPSRWPRGTLFYLQQLALTSSTSGGRSVGIVRSRTQATECECETDSDRSALKQAAARYSETLVESYLTIGRWWSWQAQSLGRLRRQLVANSFLILCELWELRLLRRWLWRMPSFGMRRRVDFFYPEDGGDTLLRNVGFHKIHTAPHPRRRHSSLCELFGNAC